MIKLFADAGTTWSKVLEIYEDDRELADSPLLEIENLNAYAISENGDYFADSQGNKVKGRTFLLPSKVFAQTGVNLDGATGHMVQQKVTSGGKYQNEVVSLAYGAKKRIKNLSTATIIDIGSRDLKWVRFEDGKYRDLDWNGSCGSVTGATVEMLCKFYDLASAKLKPQEEKIPVTCGVFAMEKIMDDIASDVSPEIAVAKYIHGIAYNTWVFAKNPKKVYLSGGFCLNQCFIDSLKFYCEVTPLGRFVLIEGLY